MEKEISRTEEVIAKLVGVIMTEAPSEAKAREVMAVMSKGETDGEWDSSKQDEVLKELIALRRLK